MISKLIVLVLVQAQSIRINTLDSVLQKSCQVRSQDKVDKRGIKISMLEEDILFTFYLKFCEQLNEFNRNMENKYQFEVITRGLVRKPNDNDHESQKAIVFKAIESESDKSKSNIVLFPNSGDMSVLIYWMIKRSRLIHIQASSGDINLFPRNKQPLMFSLAPPDQYMYQATLQAAKSMGCKKLILISQIEDKTQILSNLIHDRAKLIGINIIKEYYVINSNKGDLSTYASNFNYNVTLNMEERMNTICKELLLQKTRQIFINGPYYIYQKQLHKYGLLDTKQIQFVKEMTMRQVEKDIKKGKIGENYYNDFQSANLAFNKQYNLKWSSITNAILGEFFFGEKGETQLSTKILETELGPYQRDYAGFGNDASLSLIQTSQLLSTDNKNAQLDEGEFTSVLIEKLQEIEIIGENTFNKQIMFHKDKLMKATTKLQVQNSKQKQKGQLKHIGDATQLNNGEMTFKENTEWELPLASKDETFDDLNGRSHDFFYSCPVGQQFQPDSEEACAPCSKGQFNSGEGARECTPCPAGHQTADVGSVVCRPCAPGYYAELGWELCKPCSQDQFNPFYGESQCSFCPPHSKTLKPNAISQSQCLCEKEYFRGELDDNECKICQKEAKCPGGLKESQVVPNPGQWVDKQLLYKCLPNSCVGGSCLLDDTCGEGYDQCLKGFTGPLCAHCVKNHVYTNSGCKSCDNMSHSSRIFILVFVLLIVAIGLIFLIKKKSVFKYYLERDIFLQIDILFIYLQLLGVLKKLKINQNSIAKTIFEALSLVNFDTNSFDIDFLNVDCIQEESPKYMHVVQFMLYPIQIVSFIQILSLVRYISTKLSKKIVVFIKMLLPNIDEASTCMIFILDFMMIIMTYQSWSIFDCQEQPFMFGENAQHYSQSNDSAIFCYSPEWQEIFYVHIGFILFQCFFPVLFKYFIQRNEKYFSKQKLKNKEGQNFDGTHFSTIENIVESDLFQKIKKSYEDKNKQAAKELFKENSKTSSELLEFYKRNNKVFIKHFKGDSKALSSLKNEKQKWEKLYTETMLSNRPGEGIQTHILMILKMLVPLLIAFLNEKLEFLIALLILQSIAKAQQIALRRPYGSISLNNITIQMSFCNGIIYACIAFFNSQNLEDQTIKRSQQLTIQIVIVVIFMIIVMAQPILSWVYLFFKKCLYIQQVINEDNWKGEQIKEKFKLIEDTNNKKKKQKKEIAEQCQIISENLRTSDSSEKIKRTASIDFESNFDLVTEQDLQNIHNSAKLVVNEAKSGLIRNVQKAQKFHKQETIAFKEHKQQESQIQEEIEGSFKRKQFQKDKDKKDHTEEQNKCNVIQVNPIEDKQTVQTETDEIIGNVKEDYQKIQICTNTISISKQDTAIDQSESQNFQKYVK